MLVCPLCRLTLGDTETTCPRDGHEGVEVQPAAVPEVVRSRFDIVAPYGRGGAGELYLVDDRQSGRRGVLKLVRVPAEATPAERARLKRELVKQATLSHAILSVPLATGDAEGRPWLFREWHEGVSLAVKLARGGALPVPEALTIAAQIAAALDELHRSGLLHRDLKPGHVIVEPQPSGLPRVRVIDAGIAARVDTSSVFEVTGTPEYLSPEQAKGKLVSFRSDLYALGCVLYEMLTGTPPFAGTTEALLQAHANEPAPTPTVSMPSGVSTLLAQLLAKEPRERPFSAQQVRRALEPFLPEDASSKREATQTFDKMSETKRPTPPTGTGTLRPPSQIPAKASVPPPPPPKNAKPKASVPPAPPRPKTTTLAGMPLRDPTEELGALDLEQAEEILRGPGKAAAIPPAPEPSAPAADAGALAAAASVPETPDVTASPAAAPPWEAAELRVTDVPAPDEGLDYDDLAETVMYDKDAPAESASEPSSPAYAPPAQVASAAVPRPKKKSRPWGLIALGLVAGICLIGSVGGGGLLWFFSSQFEASPPIAEHDPDLFPTPVAAPQPQAYPEPSAFAEPTPVEPVAQPVVAPVAAPEPVVAPTPEPTPEPVAVAPTPEPEPARAEEPARERTPREPRAEREPREAAPSRGSRFEQAREEALTHFRARNFAEAAAAYERATQANPRHAGSYAGLGACRLALRQPDQAVRAYQRAISLSPRHAGFYAALGQAYHQSGDAGRARDAYNRALALDPSNNAARQGLSRL